MNKRTANLISLPLFFTLLFLVGCTLYSMLVPYKVEVSDLSSLSYNGAFYVASQKYKDIIYGDKYHWSTPDSYYRAIVKRDLDAKLVDAERINVIVRYILIHRIVIYNAGKVFYIVTFAGLAVVFLTERSAYAD